jgi:transcription initiation factor IIF auxiliary subunit
VAKTSEEDERVVYLVHTAGRPRVDDDGVERRVIQVELDADDEDTLHKVERVIYHLHPSFPEPNREVKDRGTHFRLRTRAWGQFNLSADVYFAGRAKPLTLFRYINF